ncbi:Fic family protein [Salmonella enterica]|nr:Fic family protein [Salmonella enterica]
MEIPPTTKIGQLVPQWDELMKIFNHIRPSDYLPWSLYHHAIPVKADSHKMWALEKLFRLNTAYKLNYFSELGHGLHFNMTPKLQAFCSQIDTHCTTSAVELLEARANKHGFIIDDRFMMEPVESALLAGATDDAADWFYDWDGESEIAASTPAQTMVQNTVMMFNEVSEHAASGKALAIADVEAWVRVLIGGNPNKAVYRVTEMKGYGKNEFMSPPRIANVKRQLGRFVQFVNSQTNEPGKFIHPFIFASILHFIVAYEKMFVDGNGRIARAMFYWWMLRNGYDAMKLISLSHGISGREESLVAGFCRTEFDLFDLTYFLENLALCLVREVEGWKTVCSDVQKDIEHFSDVVIAGPGWGLIPPAARWVASRLIGHTGELTEDDVADVISSSGGIIKTAASTIMKQLFSAGVLKRDDEKRYYLNGLDGELDAAINS